MGSDLAADILQCSPRLQETDVALNLTSRRLDCLEGSVFSLLTEICSRRANGAQSVVSSGSGSGFCIPASLQSRAASAGTSGPAALGPAFARSAVNVAFAFLRQAWRQGGQGGDPGEAVLADTLMMFQELPDGCMFGASKLVWRDVAEKCAGFLQQCLVRCDSLLCTIRAFFNITLKVL